MEKKDVEALVGFFISNYQTVSGTHCNEPVSTQLYEVAELTKSVFLDTASVPEKLFACDLLELVLRHDKDLSCGVFTEEDIAELSEPFGDEPHDFAAQFEKTLMMYINPKELFLGGKIRPDV